MALKRCIATLVAALNISGQAGANVNLHGRTTSFQKCLDAGDAKRGIMPAIIGCYQQELSKQNHQLNYIYQIVVKRLPLEQKRNLQNAERIWIGDRDRECIARSKQDDGDDTQDQTMSWFGCLIEKTDQRIQWLNTRFVHK